MYNYKINLFNLTVILLLKIITLCDLYYSIQTYLCFKDYLFILKNC